MYDYYQSIVWCYCYYISSHNILYIDNRLYGVTSCTQIGSTYQCNLYCDDMTHSDVVQIISNSWMVLHKKYWQCWSVLQDCIILHECKTSYYCCSYEVTLFKNQFSLFACTKCWMDFQTCNIAHCYQSTACCYCYYSLHTIYSTTCITSNTTTRCHKLYTNW